MRTKHERLAVLFDRLAKEAPASTAAEAFSLVFSTFVAIEDMLCDEANDRMMPPSGDFWFPIEGRSDLDVYRHAAHDTIIGANGAILFRIRKTSEIQFSKAGADGKEVRL